MHNLKFLIFTIFFLFSVTNTFATAQYPDKLIYKQKTHNLHTNPLQSYFRKNSNKLPESNISSSALDRGYVATFKFEKKVLYLKELETMISDPKFNDSNGIGWKSILSKVFPEKQKRKLNWFTGILIVPSGNVVEYIHMGYESTYENYILIGVKNGYLESSRNYNYKEFLKFKERQFQAFKVTAEYKKISENLNKKSRSQQLTDLYLKKHIINHTSKFLVD